jgi:hypothetical protein
MEIAVLCKHAVIAFGFHRVDYIFKDIRISVKLIEKCLNMVSYTKRQ